MYLTMIGTGNAFSKQYYNNNGLIEYKGTKLLIDCGTTLPYALYQYRYSFNEIEGVIITHIHADHIGGLETYAYQMKYQYKRKPKLYIASTLIDILWEQSLMGGLKQADDETIHHYFDVMPLTPGEPFEIIDGLRLNLVQTRHIPNRNSYSLLFNNTFFFSGDCIFEEDILLELHEKQIELFYHDCQFINPGTVHAALEELKTLPYSLQRKIKLMHYADNMDEFVEHAAPMAFVTQGKKVHIPI